MVILIRVELRNSFLITLSGGTFECGNRCYRYFEGFVEGGETRG